MKRSKIVYIDPNDAGRPCQTIGQLLGDVVDAAQLSRPDHQYVGVSTRAAKGRRKVRITIIVEPVR